MIFEVAVVVVVVAAVVVVVSVLVVAEAVAAAVGPKILGFGPEKENNLILGLKWFKKFILN